MNKNRRGYLIGFIICLSLALSPAKLGMPDLCYPILYIAAAVYGFLYIFSKGANDE
jgi:hypothetical protein